MMTNVRTYAYDAAGRLSQTWSNGVSFATYQYDANGNRTNAVVGGIAKTGQYDAQDRLLAYGAATYQYDAHGTLTNKTDGGQSTAYRYDARGSLLQVRPGTNVIAYSVDALDRRIARTKNGATTQRFVYQGFLAPIAELNADGSVASRFVYATRANVPDYMVRSGTTYRLVTDIRGSVRLVVNAANGSVAQRLDYDEWGRVLRDTNPGFQPFGFAGGLYDPDTGLVRFGYRDYDPDTGRWSGKDPILFGGDQVNLYLYCYNDPINYIDISGLLPGDLYDTPNDAAKAAMHENTSRGQILERGGAIYRCTDENGNEKYSYTDTIVGGLFSVDVGPAFSKIPQGSKPIGFWHSHTFLGNLSQPNFSKRDLDLFKKFKQGQFGLYNNWTGEKFLYKKVLGQPDEFITLK